MANSHDEECLPPTEFILSTIQHDKSDRVHGGEAKYLTNPINANTPTSLGADYAAANSPGHAGIHCQNCLRRVNGLLCSRCVLGQTSFPEKRRALTFLRAQRNQLSDSYCQRWNSGDHAFTGHLIADAAESKNEMERNIARLSTIIRLKRDAIDRNLSRLRSIHAERSRRVNTAAKLRQLVDFTQKKCTVASRPISVASLDRRRRDLASTRQRLVADLLRNIFPIDIVSTTGGSSTTGASVSSSSTVAAAAADQFESIIGGGGIADILTDATMTTFQHDRWIFMGSSPDVQYRFVRSCLAPDHGDYSLLKGWLFNEAAFSGRTATGEASLVYNNQSLATTLENASSSTNRTALGMLSSLAYCAQTVNVLARICDVRLPFSLTFMDFFIDKLKEDELDTAIIKLNANVAIVCCSQQQRIDYDSISFERPFWNLYNLSKNIKDLAGFQAHFTIDARLARGFTDAEKRITWSERRATVTVPESADDWENIDEQQVPEWTGAASSPPSFTQLWASAATSVANLFKMHN